MRNNKETLGWMVCILMVGLLLSVVVPLMMVRVVVAGVALMAMMVVWLRGRRYDMDYMQAWIKKRMLKSECSCRIADGSLFVIDHNHKFEVRMEPEGRRLWRVTVSYCYSLEEFEHVSEVGQDVLNGLANRERLSTVVVRKDGMQYCRYVGAIRNVGDFMEMYERAKDSILVTVGWIKEHSHGYHRNYPKMTGDRNSPFWNKLSELSAMHHDVVVKREIRNDC